MSENETQAQESQKTVVAFVAGLLIGGLLVWVFSDAPEAAAPTDEVSDEAAEVEEVAEGVLNTNANTEAAAEVPTMTIGDGSIDVSDQAAGNTVVLDRATFPTANGWVAVRSYPNGQLGSILGAVRYSEEQGLVPQEVPLLAPTTAGRTYAVVFFSEDGDYEFNLANDAQIDGILSTFTAQ